MTTDVKPIKKKKGSRLWITLGVLLLIAAIIFLFSQYRQQQAMKTTLANLNTIPLNRDTLRTTINGTGNVRPQQSAVLLWQSGGSVGNISVEVNQEVHNGDILLNLDEDDLPAEILQARLSVLSAEQALESLEANTKIQRVTLNNNIQQAEENILSLNNQMINLENRACADWRLNNLQRDYDVAFENYQEWPTESRWLAVQAARIALDYCDPVVVNQQLASLQGQLDLSEQNINQWQADLAKINTGVDPVEKEKLELQLDLAKKQLENQYVLAPFNGTILKISQKAGDPVSPGLQAVEIADLSNLFVEVPVSEVDIPTIQVGQKAQLSFDAYYEDTFTGEVTAISETGDRTTGVVNYLVTIKMNESGNRIKPGMTAGVQILTEEKHDVLVVPFEAVIARDGQDYVYVLRNNNPILVAVTVGGYSSRMVEILEADIQEGELIILNPPTSLIDRFGFGNMVP